MFRQLKGLKSAAVAVVCWAAVCGLVRGDVVKWEFPRMGSCHEGMAFADGVTGVLVWGGGDEVRLTVGRADMWDHRGGYQWKMEQSYTNILAAVESGDKTRLLGLFKKETVKGQPRNPYMLPLGRVVVKLAGAELVRGELDVETGLGVIEYRVAGEMRKLKMAMSRAAFAMKAESEFTSEVVPAMDWPRVKEELGPIGFKAAKVAADGFTWGLPADKSVTLKTRKVGKDFFVWTWRGEEAKAVADGETYERVAAESVAHWRAFWAEGARVKVPDEVVQRVFDYGMYRFGAMTEVDGVPAGLQGPWLEDDKLVPWNGDYHFNINVQECYSPAYRGGHAAHLMPLFRMVLSWRPILRENARRFCGIEDGYSLPHSVDDRGVCIGGFWTGTIDHGSTAWVAAMMYQYVAYTGDVAFLKAGAYDFMKGAMNVYWALFEKKNGALAMAMGPSPEWGGSHAKGSVGRNPSFQLAAAHRLAKDLMSAAKLLGEAPDPRWIEVEKRLPKFAADESGILLFEGQRLTESHRHHSHMAGLYPFDVIDLGDGKVRGIVEATYATWGARGTRQWTGWCVPWASILYTHIGDAGKAVEMIRAWDKYFCDEGHGSHHNAVLAGFTDWTGGDIGGVMQMDGQCAAASAVMELMVHEVNGKVEFFRVCPAEWKDVSFENIALSDGRRVSGRRVNGKMTIEYKEAK